jgi:chemotaxis protein MotB
MIKTEAVLTLCTLILSACVSQQQYDAVVAENEQLQAQRAVLQAEQKFVEASDLLFPLGGYQLSPAGQAELANNIAPRLRGLQNAKIVVYGYIDNVPIGPDLQRQGVPDNLVLSTRRAAAVANYLVSQGVNPNIISAKGFGDTRPVAPNDTPQGRAQNRRIEITLQGPGAAQAELPPFQDPRLINIGDDALCNHSIFFARSSTLLFGDYG